MTVELLTYLNVMLLSRLVFTRRDGPIALGTSWVIFVPFTALLLLMFQVNVASLSAVAMAGLVLFWEPLLGARVDMSKGFRLLGLALQVLVPVYAGSYASGFLFSTAPVAMVEHLLNHLSFLASATPQGFQDASLVLLGLLLLGNETNILVRAVFHHLGLEPRRADDHEIDAEEYNAGRVIGILERWLMLLVVLWSDDLSALAFIIAAKGLARFRQLEEKQFAEYMLVGTLLSALVSVLLGRAIRVLVNPV